MAQVPMMHPSLRASPINAMPITPRGLEALYLRCKEVYPDQLNPLQVTAVVKYWLGGPDPLDYISMYANPGDESIQVPAHWHYVSFGLSDLHGDGRVHDAIMDTMQKPSGFGFELTFRLRREIGETAPPTWPATLMQALAKYVFGSGNTLCPGDHVSWHCALDNSESRIQHMLMCQDPQLGKVQTPFGEVDFVQIVGITKEELQSAQHWNGPGVLDILRTLPGTGGDWLVTDMRRGESMQELDPASQDVVNRGIEMEGSNLSGVSARCSWIEVEVDEGCGAEGGGGVLREGPCIRETEGPRISQKETQQIKSELTRGLLNSLPGGIKTEVDDEDEKDDQSQENIAESSELILTRYLDGLHLTFNLESGILLPLAIRGRVKHGRHFTFKSVLGDTAITFVAASVTGTFVNPATPYASHGPWLQVLIPDDLAAEMARDFDILSANVEDITLPRTFSWGRHRLNITVVAD